MTSGYPLPSYKHGYADGPARSATPGLWKELELAWCPALGTTGLETIRNASMREESEVYVSNDGIITGATYEQTEYGQAFKFSGSEYVSSPNLYFPFDPTATSFSIHALFKPTVSNTNKGVFSCTSSPTSGTVFWLCWSPSAGNLRLLLNGPGQVDFAYTVGQWQALTITHEKTSGLTNYYANGKQVHTATAAVSGYAVSYEHYIGTGYNGGCTGLIPAYYLWTRAITPTEVRILHNEPLAPFRLKRRVLASVPAAGGGLSIPIAAYHYNHSLSR